MRGPYVASSRMAAARYGRHVLLSRRTRAAVAMVGGCVPMAAASLEVVRPACAEMGEGCPDGPGLSSTHRGRAMRRCREVFVGIDPAKAKMLICGAPRAISAQAGHGPNLWHWAI
jgi:hypothetical protein